MRLRTITTPNGKEGVRETRYGLQAIVPVAAVLLSVLAAWVSMNREQATNATEIRLLREDLKNDLPGQIISAVDAADRSAGYLTKSEYLNARAEQAALTKDWHDDVIKRLDAINLELRALERR